MAQIEDLYTELITRINTILPAIKHIDWYTGQLEDEQQGKGSAIQYPAVFFNLQPIQWQQLGRRAKEAIVTLEVILATKNVNHSNNIVSSTMRSKALNHFELLDNIEAVLHGFQPTTANVGTLNTAAPVNFYQPAQAGVIAHSIPFRVRLFSEVAAVQYTTVPKPPLVLE